MYIYKTTNLINGKIYIGQSTKSIKETKNYLGSGQPYFINALKKYGKENFKKEILEVCNSLEELNKKEKFWIKEFNSLNSNIGYNLQNGGSGYTEELKLRQSKNRKDKPSHKKGIPLSIETREKMSKTRKGMKKSDEHKRKIGIANLGNKHNKGRKCSEEVKQKISKALKGRKQSEEQKLQNSISLQKFYNNLTKEQSLELLQKGRKTQGEKLPYFFRVFKKENNELLGDFFHIMDVVENFNTTRYIVKNNKHKFFDFKKIEK